MPETAASDLFEMIVTVGAGPFTPVRFRKGPVAGRLSAPVRYLAN